MDRVMNPYAPGAGRRPAALVGRNSEREAWFVSLQRAEVGRIDPPFVLYGLRGVGKTVLLADLRRAAEDRDWIVAQVEAGADASLRSALGEALHGPLADLARPSAGKRLLKALKTALSFKASYDTDGTWNFGLDLTGTAGGGADTGVLETDLRKVIKDLASAADEEGIGVAILIDEAQDLKSSELVALGAIAHSAAQEGWRVLFALAGLPSLPRVLTEAKSYAERFVYAPIRQLDDAAASEAITKPAADDGVQWEQGGVDLIVRATHGYPYFLQQLGQEAWNAAEGVTISESDARAGAARGMAALDNGFFRARWDRATPAEQRYLRAMSEDGDEGSAARDVASRLGRVVSSVSPIRAGLVAKGLIFAPEHGRVAFTVPGMAGFIDRQADPGAAR